MWQSPWHNVVLKNDLNLTVFSPNLYILASCGSFFPRPKTVMSLFIYFQVPMQGSTFNASNQCRRDTYCKVVSRPIILRPNILHLLPIVTHHNPHSPQTRVIAIPTAQSLSRWSFGASCKNCYVRFSSISWVKRPQGSGKKTRIIHEFRPGRGAMQWHCGLRLFFKNQYNTYITVVPHCTWY